MESETPDHAIDYVEFSASDLRRARKFYETAFGWTFQSWGDDYIGFSDRRLQGGFQRIETEPQEAEGHGPLIVLFSRDLEAIRQVVRDLGGRIVRDIFPFPGGRRFHFRDTEGNVLAIWSDREPMNQV